MAQTTGLDKDGNVQAGSNYNIFTVNFDYTISGVSVLANGATPTYIIGSANIPAIGVYQGGSVRGIGVIGAYEKQ